jgi:hypothetical protein
MAGRGSSNACNGQNGSIDILKLISPRSKCESDTLSRGYRFTEGPASPPFPNNNDRVMSIKMNVNGIERFKHHIIFVTQA